MDWMLKINCTHAVKPYLCMGLLLLLVNAGLHAQLNPNRLGNLGGNRGNRYSGDKKNDTAGVVKHRTGLEDSITISFRYIDTSRYSKFDSSILDFTRRFPIPYNYMFLGNNGTAAMPLNFSPIMKSGWDAGFHAFDIYKFNIADTRFYNTTRPYSEIGYTLGSKAEQLVHALLTQNINANWNVAGQINLVNSPGFFKNQNSNHSRYRINTAYQSPNRRYHLYFIVFNNKIQVSENGGITRKDLIDSVLTYRERTNIPVNLGSNAPSVSTTYGGKIVTGNKYKEFQVLLRQQYDIGKKDSVVTDSNVVYLFYPKLRAEHTIEYRKYQYQFIDEQPPADYYKTNYNFLIAPPANFTIQENWKEMINDFSLYSFPESKNPQQFIKAGVSVQNLTGTFDNGERKFYNLFLHGEYRNKTRNKKWDLEADGKFYLTGLNSGDYDANASLQRYLSKKLGYLQIGFANVNRTPSFIFDKASSFNFDNNAPTFNKENITRLSASVYQPLYKLKLSASYFLVTNLAYFKNFYQASQQSGLFNLLQITAEKEMRLKKHLVWHAMVMLQQRAGNGPVNVPLFFTRNQIGYEGTLGFKNLIINTGLDIKYLTPYKAAGYSPMLAQFYYQNAQTTAWKAPQVDAYMHFRIRTFTMYVRAENLNTTSLKGGFGFTSNNFSTGNYAYPGLQIRVGIFWSFVN
jgi:Putative porin